jgi:hypothetical protein
MKVLNLCCAQGHGFEGWFASEDDFLAQSSRGALECPMCADKAVTRLPSAPRLNLSGARSSAVAKTAGSASAASAPAAAASAEASVADLQAMWLKTVQQVLKNTEDVGERFPEEARRIHYGETGHRGIRGQASAEERAALADEGIEVMALPMPTGLKGPAH